MEMPVEMPDCSRTVQPNRPNPPKPPNLPNLRNADKVIKAAAPLQLQHLDLLEFAVARAQFRFDIGWFHRVLATTLQRFMKAVEDKKAPRLIIEAPPRHSKTEMTVRAFVPWVLGHHSEYEMVVATYGQELADDHGRDMRQVLSSAEYRRVFPGIEVDKTRRSVDNVAIRGGKGGFKTVGVGTALTGRGAHILVIDDPIKDLEEARSETHTRKLYEWFQSVALTRIAPGGGIIVMATRWSELDLTGRILAGPMGKKFHRLSFPALAVKDEKYRKCGEALIPERFSTEHLQEIRDNTEDPKIWSSLYQQQPFSDEGAMFKVHHAKFILPQNLPEPSQLNYYITLDPAASERDRSDYWAGLVAGLDHDFNLYIVDQIHLRGADAVTKYIDSVFNHVTKYNPLMTFMERCHATNVLEPSFKRGMRERNKYFRYETLPTGNKDKVSRAQSIAARFAQGRIYFIDTPFMRGTALPELVKFPDGANDDLADCMAMLGAMLDGMYGKAAPIPLPSIGSGEDVLKLIRRGKNKEAKTNVGLASVPSQF